MLMLQKTFAVVFGQLGQRQAPEKRSSSGSKQIVSLVILLEWKLPPLQDDYRMTALCANIDKTVAGKELHSFKISARFLFLGLVPSY